MAPTATEEDVQKVTLTQPNPVAQIAKAEAKISQGGVRAPGANEVRNAFIREAAAQEAAGTSRADVVKAMADAVEEVRAGNVLGPTNVVEVASGGGVIGHYDRNPVDSVVDTGQPPTGDTLVAQTAEVATPQGDASVLDKGATKTKKASSSK